MSRPPTRRQSVVKDKAKFVGMPTRLCLGSLTHINTTQAGGPKRMEEKIGAQPQKRRKRGAGRVKEGAGRGRAWLAALPLSRFSRPLPRVVALLICAAARPPAHQKQGRRRAEGGASTCPLLPGAARLSRGISPSPWRRALVARGVRLGLTAFGSVRCSGLWDWEAWPG